MQSRGALSRASCPLDISCPLGCDGSTFFAIHFDYLMSSKYQSSTTFYSRIHWRRRRRRARKLTPSMTDTDRLCLFAFVCQMWNRCCCCWCYCNRDSETTGCTSGCTTTCAFSSARLSPPYSLFTVWGVIQLNIWMTKKAKWTHHAAGIKRKKMRGGHSSRKSLFRWLSSYRPSDSTNNVSVRYRFLSTPGVGRVGSLFYRLDCLSTRCCSSAKMSLHHSAPCKTHTNRPQIE